MLLTGAVSGVIAGLLGVGGGIVIVPVLEAVLEILGVDAAFRMHIAVATSLAVIIPTSISSAVAHNRRQSVDHGVVRSWSPFIFFGAVAGIVISASVSGRFLAGVFATIAAILAINMIAHFGDRKLGDDLPRSPLLPVLPFSIGTISTLMGIGGGSMTVPALTVYNRPIHLAVGTSALLGLVIAVPAAIGYIVTGWGNTLLPNGSFGYLNLFGFALITPTSVLFAPVGAKIAHAISRRRLSILFGLFLLTASIRMGYQAF
ncbi:MAG: sulfite exporter TauE/SafE family protein [Gammaproteobacteria bacterium]|nr:sulfite exporter TauE/SafE family protein [Gammaproteobacteria bacterium]